MELMVEREDVWIASLEDKPGALAAKLAALADAGADLATIQDLLGHGQITTTQRYCWVANLKVQRDYYKAMEVVLQRTQARGEEEDEGENMDSPWRPQ